MRFAHSFFTEPLKRNKFSGLEDSIRITLTDYACSLAWIHRCGYEITLYTDDPGAKLFDFLPYDEVVILDQPKYPSIHFAAQFKFEAMKDMKLGDILIDGDLIIRDRNTIKMIENDKSDILFSFFEPYDYVIDGGNKIPFYNELLGHLNKFSFSEPYKIPKIEELGWPNTSMTKFTNQDLKNKYIKQYEENIEKLHTIDFGKTWPDIIIEQYFLKLLCEENNYSYNPFIPNYPTPESNQYSCSLKFTHLGSAKKSANNIVEEWLKNANQLIYRNTIKEIDKYLKSPELIQKL